MAQIEAVAFDKDGVIFDSERIYHQALLATLAQHDLMFSSEFLAQFQGMSTPKVIAILKEAVQDKVNPEMFVKQWIKACERSFQEEKLTFISGIESVIETLYDQGYPLALVTADSQEGVLRDFSSTRPDLLAYFRVIITLDDVNEAKPNPEAYERAMALLGVAPESLLVLEDSDVGGEAACAAQAKVLLYRPDDRASDELTQRVTAVIRHPKFLLDYLL